MRRRHFPSRAEHRLAWPAWSACIIFCILLAAFVACAYAVSGIAPVRSSVPTMSSTQQTCQFPGNGINIFPGRLQAEDVVHHDNSSKILNWPEILSGIPTTTPTTVPTALSDVPSQAEIAARADAAYTEGYARLATMQRSYQTWTIPSRPDLIAFATDAKTPGGLTGDGVTDDTAALQALLDRLPGGSTIYFPPGDYRIDGPIAITKPFTLFGEADTVFDCRRATRDVFTVNTLGSPTSMMTGMVITGIVFEGPGIETDPTIIDAYFMQDLNISYIKMHNVGSTAISLSTCTDSTIESCVFDNVFKAGSGYGVCIMDRSDRITIRDSFFVTKGRHGIATGTRNANLAPENYVREVIVDNNYFEHTTNDAVNAHAPTVGPYRIDGNVFYKCNQGVALLHGQGKIVNNVIIDAVSGVVLFREPFNSNTPPELGIDQVNQNIMIDIDWAGVEADRSTINIRDNTIRGTGGEPGITIDDSTHQSSIIEGNVIERVNGGIKIGSLSGVSMVNNWVNAGNGYQVY